MTTFSKLLRHPWTVPALFLGLLFASFGLLIPWLGFYWDDWPVVFLAHTQVTEGYWDFYAFDRPFSAWTYILTVPILGTTPLNWHLFTLLLRWLAVVGMWWALRGLWPGRERQVTWMALAFSVYPVFFQQSISVAYSQHFITYALFFLSLGAMVWALRNAERFLPLTALALLAAPLHMLTMEYFVGLELIRPALLWLLMGERAAGWRQRLRLTLKYWLPYLLILLVFVIWRLFFLNLPDDPNAPRFLYALQDAPAAALLALVENILRDFVHVIVTSWSATLQPALIELGDRTALLFWGLAALAGIAVAFIMLRKYPEREEGAADESWGLQAALFGLYATFVSLTPVWFTGRELLGGLYSDRFSLPAMFGASVLVVSVLEVLTPRRLPKLILLSAILGLAVAAHLRVGNSYRQDWTKQVRFYWQMQWRAPALEPNTPIVAEGALSGRVSGYVAATALNSLYPQATGPQEQSYWYFEIFRGFHRQVPEFISGMDVSFALRTLQFSGYSLDSLFVHYEPEAGRCLWVLGPEDARNIELTETTRQLLPAANLDRIQPFAPQQSASAVSIFGAEPARTWCYFYQRAQLARQQGDWEQVLSLGEQADARGHAANNGYERIPFIEAYAAVGDWDQAADLTLTAYKKDFRAQAMLCDLWERLGAGVVEPETPGPTVGDVMAQLDCSGP